MDIKKLQEKVDEYKDDSAFTHRANEIMAKFEQKCVPHRRYGEREGG